ncbi:MAG: DUF2865 domain-containing protein [Methylocystis sp.]|uniref:DUF2865 domain-containing protein n=1 Tax=Methylocystis sp. TaxID=1911079 RepID=UPI003DA5BD78
MRPTLGPETIRTTRFLAPRAAALLAAFFIAPVARAESPRCMDLRAQIAKAGQEGMAARYRAAAAKQRAEYSRLAVKGRSMGCNRQQFLFFGEPRPPQCDGINARLGALQASIAAYDQGASDDSQRQALMARYEVECRPQQRAPAEPDPGSFFEELFGVRPPDQGAGLRDEPVDPSQQGEAEEVDQGARPMGGPMAICVRSCDGGFFPITYSARHAQLEDLGALCKAMCPGAEAKLYTQSQWKGLESAVSIDGEPYADHPNARKFETKYDPTCGCKPPGQSWTEALAEAERILAERNRKDQMVTAEQAEQMSRPIPAAVRPRNPLEPAPPATAPEPDPKGSVTLGAPDVFREVVGPDGVKRRVRVVAPLL